MVFRIMTPRNNSKISSKSSEKLRKLRLRFLDKSILRPPFRSSRNGCRFSPHPFAMSRRRQCRTSLCSRFSLRRSHSASSSPIMTQPYLKSFPNLLLCLLSYLPAVSVQDGRPSPISDIFSRFETFSPKVSSCAASHECMAPAPPCAPRSGLFTSPFHIIWRQLCHQ